MVENHSVLLLLLAPAFLLLTALLAWFQPGLRPKIVLRLIAVAGIWNLGVAAVAIALYLTYGTMQSATFGLSQLFAADFAAGLGLAIRLDALSLVMFVMIALLGFFILRFSRTYLDGDARQGVFLGRMALTLSSVQFLVLAANLLLLLIAWIITSLALQKLLEFYRERRGAQIAAQKKFITARLSDAFLLLAVALLYWQFGTGDLQSIFNALAAGFTPIFPGVLEVAAAAIAIAALLKAAQFPTHGWLIEVMEAPTPVSALLHAGILNAGPFLIIRLAGVLEATYVAPLLLIAIGGFTAWFAAQALLTQSTVKGSLGYSSAAHMGFSLFVSGLGLYGAALLHLVSHSFYKAHAFLSSSSAIEKKRSITVRLPQRFGQPWRMLTAVVLAVAIFVSLAYWLNFSTAMLPLGVVIILGLSQLIVAIVDSPDDPRALGWIVSLAAVVTVTFLLLEHGAFYLLAAVIPETSERHVLTQLAAWLVVAAFAVASYWQMQRANGQTSPAQRQLALLLQQGFYANAYFDRLINAWRYRQPKVRRTTAKSALPPESLA